MGEISVFEGLVKQLTEAGRRDLLEKIQRSLQPSPEPLRTAKPEDVETVDVEEELDNLNPFRRIFLFLWSLVSGNDQESLVRRMLFKRLRVRIGEIYTGLLDFTDDFFTEKFYSELERLKKAVNFLRSPLTDTLIRNKVAFFAFLAGIELNFEEKLGEEFRSIGFWDNIELHDDSVPKKEMIEVIDGVFDAISPEEKKWIYQDAQSLYALSALSKFPIDRILTTFQKSGGFKCDAALLTKSLMRLSELLHSAHNSPSLDALRALFLFHYGEKLGQADFHPDEELSRDFSGAEKTLDAIRAFNERIPLTFIIQYVTRDLGYKPVGIGGAEDWFVSFKEFWYRRIDRAYAELNRKKRKQQFGDDAKTHLGMSELSLMPCFRSEPFDDSIRSLYEMSMTFLRRLFDQVFQKSRRNLQILLLKAQFYKEQNRSLLEETIEYMSRLGARITFLVKRFEAGGDLGSRYQALLKEPLEDKELRERTKQIVTEFDREAAAMIEKSIQNLSDLLLVLDGVLHGKPGDKYDTLTNLDSVGGRDNRQFRMLWQRGLDEISSAANLLKDIYRLESDGE